MGCVAASESCGRQQAVGQSIHEKHGGEGPNAMLQQKVILRKCHHPRDSVLDMIHSIDRALVSACFMSKAQSRPNCNAFSLIPHYVTHSRLGTGEGKDAVLPGHRLSSFLLQDPPTVIQAGENHTKDSETRHPSTSSALHSTGSRFARRRHIPNRTRWYTSGSWPSMRSRDSRPLGKVTAAPTRGDQKSRSQDSGVALCLRCC